jgi:hypothetical protein
MSPAMAIPTGIAIDCFATTSLHLTGFRSIPAITFYTLTEQLLTQKQRNGLHKNGAIAPKFGASIPTQFIAPN